MKKVANTESAGKAVKTARPRKKRKEVSNAEIARTAGVSPGLVSAFFSGNHYSPKRRSGIGISESTRQKIKKACIKLKYVPDSPLGFYRLFPEKADVAFLLNAGIGAGFSNPYHALVFDGFAKAAFAAEVDLSNLFFHPDHDYLVSPEQLPNSILRGHMKKVALTGYPFNYSLVYQLMQMDVAVVAAGQAPPIDGLVSVVPDFYEAGRLAIQQMHEAGHRLIGIGASDRYMRQDVYNGKLLSKGCRDGLADYGLTLWGDEFMILGGSSIDERCQRWAKAVVDSKAPPSAVFFFDDHLARVFVEALSSHGLRVPQDLSIIGCNDDLLNQKNQGGFSTIHLPCAEIGARAFEELNRLAVEGRPKSSETIMLPVKYLDRGTLRSAG